MMLVTYSYQYCSTSATGSTNSNRPGNNSQSKQLATSPWLGSFWEGEGRGLTRSAVGSTGPGVKLHARRQIHLGAAEQLLGARFEAEVAGYAWVWCQKGKPQLHC